MEVIKALKQESFKIWSERFKISVEELEKMYQKHKEEMLKFQENRDIPETDFENRALNTFADSLTNAQGDIAVFPEFVFVGCDEVVDFDGYRVRVVQQRWNEAKEPERAKMIADGKVMTMVVQGTDGKEEEVAVCEIKKHEVTKDGIYIVIDGTPWSPNCGKPVIVRDDVKTRFEKPNKRYSYPLYPNPHMDVYGVGRIDSNFYKVKIRVYGEFCNPQSPKFVGRLPLFTPVELRGIISEDLSEKDLIVLKNFDYVPYTTEDIQNAKWNINSFLQSASQVIRKISCREWPSFFEEFQAAKNEDGTLKIRTSGKFSAAVINDNVFAVGEYIVKKVTSGKKGVTIRVADASATLPGGQEIYLGHARSWHGESDFQVGASTLFAFKLNRSNTRWQKETLSAVEVGFGSGDCSMEILGFTCTSRSNVNLENAKKDAVVESDLD